MAIELYENNPAGTLKTVQATGEKGAASGYASLDAGTKVPTAELGGAGADNTKYLRGDQTWNVPPGTGSAGLSLLFDSTLGADAATIDTGAAGVAAGHKQLCIFTVLRTDEAVKVTVAGLRINNDSAANYDRQIHRLANATTSGIATAAQTSWQAPLTAGANATAAFFGMSQIWVPNYDDTTMDKLMFGQCQLMSTVAVADFLKDNSVGHWRSTAAISRIALVLVGGTVFKAGSRMTIFGTS